MNKEDILKKKNRLLQQENNKFKNKSFIKLTFDEHEPKVSQFKKELVSLDNDRIAVMYNIADFHYSGKIKESQEHFNKIANIILEQKGSDNLIINFLGDMIDGVLRISALRNSALYVKQTKDMIYVLREFLRYIADSKIFKTISVNYITSSNHSQLRTLQTDRDTFPEEDMEIIIADSISQSSYSIPITFKLGREIIIKTKNYNILLIHGHQITSKNGWLQKWTSFNNIHIDYLIAGHYHHYLTETIHKAYKNKKCYNKYYHYAPSCKLDTHQYEINNLLSSQTAISKVNLLKNKALTPKEIVIE